MSIEELEKQLEEGKLTQEQFDEMVRILGLEVKPNPEPAPEPQPEPDDIDKLIKKAVDRATNKLGNENKTLREKLERLKKTKLTAEEIAEEERREKEKALDEREAAVKAAENRMFALKQIKKSGLDSMLYFPNSFRYGIMSALCFCRTCKLYFPNSFRYGIMTKLVVRT